MPLLDAALARPGLRIPFQRAQALERIVVDTRERYGYTFGSSDVPFERATLRQGDCLALVGEYTVAVVERKSAADFAHSLVDGKLACALAELSALPSAAVVVETSYSKLLRSEHVSGAFLADMLARIHVRYPNVPIVFVESRAFGRAVDVCVLPGRRCRTRSRVSAALGVHTIAAEAA